MFVSEPCPNNENEEAVANELDEASHCLQPASDNDATHKANRITEHRDHYKQQELSHCLQPVVAIGRVPLLVV